MLPDKLLNKLNSYEYDNKKIVNTARNVSDKYHNENGKNKILVSSKEDVLAYALYRMPATFEVLSNVIKQVLQITKLEEINSVLDVGSGTGSAVWAFNELINVKHFTCLERENEMINFSKDLLKEDKELFSKVEWIKEDLANLTDENKADVIMCSYVLNESSDERRLQIVEKLWNITNDILIIVEPGTPECFRQINLAKSYLLNKGANIVAPCTQNEVCPKKDGDWCRFSCRVSRSKITKQIKNASVSFEDEKFTYMVFSKQKYDLPKYRVITKPFYRPKVVEFEVCPNSSKKSVIITKSQKEKYKKARDLNLGDEYND